MVLMLPMGTVDAQSQMTEGTDPWPPRPLPTSSVPPLQDHGVTTTPVFGCCRKTVAVAVAGVDPVALLAMDATARVQALRPRSTRSSPATSTSHRCCIGHIADLAFDLPDLLAGAGEPETAAL